MIPIEKELISKEGMGVYPFSSTRLKDVLNGDTRVICLPEKLFYKYDEYWEPNYHSKLQALRPFSQNFKPRFRKPSHYEGLDNKNKVIDVYPVHELGKLAIGDFFIIEADYNSDINFYCRVVNGEKVNDNKK